MIIPILLLLLFTAGVSVGNDVFSGSQINNNSTKESLIAATMVNISNQARVTPTANITKASIAPALNLKYIWSISGIEKDQITMALNQDGNDLFGLAKYDPENGEPWNGVVAGFISGNQVHLAIASLKDKEQVSTVMVGIFAGDAISGNFSQSNGGKISSHGEFNAIWINQDLSSYTPVTIKAIKPEISVQAANGTGDVTVPSGTYQTFQQAGSQKSRFHDIHQDADRIQTGVGDISGIPIGMSGLT